MKLYDCKCGILQSVCMHECEHLQREQEEKVILKE